MESFRKFNGIALPLLRANVDTDQIISATDVLRASAEDSYGELLFARWRYLPDGTPNQDFILNQSPWSRAVFLLADRNFGCGSSREDAPKALRGFGFRAVIAPSFGGIFYNNSFRNGVLPVELPIEQIREIAAFVSVASDEATITVDLEQECITVPDGRMYAFGTPPALRRMLLEGLDEIDLTLTRQTEILAFREHDRASRPWAYTAAQPSTPRTPS